MNPYKTSGCLLKLIKHDAHISPFKDVDISLHHFVSLGPSSSCVYEACTTPTACWIISTDNEGKRPGLEHSWRNINSDCVAAFVPLLDPERVNQKPVHHRFYCGLPGSHYEKALALNIERVAFWPLILQNSLLAQPIAVKAKARKRKTRISTDIKLIEICCAFLEVKLF